MTETRETSPVRTPTEIRTAITNRVFEVIRLYNDLLPNNYLHPDNITVKFTLRGTSAGTATWTHSLNFNLRLAADNFDDFIAQTVPHEVVHLFQTHIDPLAPSHGDLWKRLMRLGGFEPRRTHRYNTTAIRSAYRTHPYVCACGDHPMSTRQHNKILRGATYRCTVCHQIIHTP